MRTVTITKEYYKFSELSDKAKERALDWYRDVVSQDYDHFQVESIYEQVAEIAPLLGIEIAKGHNESGMALYWSGFSYQGDGASFEGSYRYAKGMVAAVKKACPGCTELQEIAQKLYELQRENGYKLEGEITTSGHYSHSHSMELSSNIDNSYIHEELQDILRSFADWIYNTMREDYFAQLEDDSLIDGIEANDYEFDEYGNAV